jgi:drug/metabolite transporter (DMT)-like permease
MTIAVTPSARACSSSTLLLLAGLSLVWGMHWPAMKFVLADVPVLTFRSLCLWITGPILRLLARLGGERIAIPGREWPALLVAALCNVSLWYFGTGMGVSLIPADRAALLAYTMPVWVALFSAVLLHERLGTRRLAGLLLGMAGIAVLLAPDAGAFRAAPLGAGFVLLAAAGWAIGTVIMKVARFSRSVAQVTGWQLIVGGFPIVLAALWYDPLPRSLSMPGATQLILLYIIALPMIFGQWAWFKTLDRLPGTVAAIGSLAVPIVGLLSSALLLGEPLGSSEIATLVLVVLTLALVLFAPPPRCPSPNPLSSAASS